MLEKCGNLPNAAPQQQKKHNFVGKSGAKSARGYPFTSSKSEVGARIPDDDRLTLHSQYDEEVGLQYNMLDEGDSSKNVLELDLQGKDIEDRPEPKSAKLRINYKGQARNDKVFGMAGTGGDFSESGLISSDAQEFMLLDNQGSEPITQDYQDCTSTSTSSMPFSAIRASAPSQSGATKMNTNQIKNTINPSKSLLNRYNQNLVKQLGRT